MTEETPSNDHSFVWWLCMLPFLAATAVFIYRWMHNQAQNEFLGYAVGSLIVGIVFSAFVSGSSGSSNEESAPAETAKSEGDKPA